jgi:membrane fusion protein, heavy metal efflux system
MTDKSVLFATLATLALGPVLTGCSGQAEARDDAPKRASEGGTVELDAAQRARIKVETVESRSFNPSIATTGTVAFDGDRSTQVIAPISGPISRILVAPGTHVERGQPLALVVSADFAAAVAGERKAEEAWHNAERIAKLDEQLFNNDALARTELDQAKADLASAAADREAALSQLRSLGLDDAAIADIQSGKPVATQEGTIRAPIAGTVVEKLIAPGQLLQAGGTPCFTIADLSTMWVMANVFEGDVSTVQRGEEASITTEVSADTLHGRVDYIAALVDPATKATAVRVVVPNRNQVLRRDMLVRVSIRGHKPRTGLLIPVTAVMRDDENLPFVFVTTTKEGGFARRRVDLGSRMNDRYEVTSGLQAGEQVVTDGALYLQGSGAQ